MLSKVGASLVRRFGTRDPFQIAKEWESLFFFVRIWLSKRNVPRHQTQSYLFSEQGSGGQNAPHRLVPMRLGHDQLHRKLAQANSLHEFMLYDMTTRPEYEANIVVAEILIDNEELLDYIYTYRYSAEQIARAMDTDINLVALKIAHLTELGYDLRPVNHRSDFCGSSTGKEFLHEVQVVPILRESG